MADKLTGAVGIFDSGLGGLTAMMALEEICPEADIIYFGDTARVPYGSRPNGELREFALQNVRLLQQFGASGVIAACGTISSLMDEELISRSPLPFSGITAAAAKKAVSLTKNGRIGVLATEATVRNRGFEKQVKALMPKAQLFYSPCPDFVPLAESGIFDPEDRRLMDAVERYLPPLLENDPDAIILGCTHYPLLAPAIRRLSGDIPLINSGGEAAAEHCRLHEVKGKGRRLYIVSGDPESFKATAEKLTGRPIPLPLQADPSAF